MGIKEVSGTLLGISERAFYSFFSPSVLEILLSKAADSDSSSVPTNMGISYGIHKDSHF